MIWQSTALVVLMLGAPAFAGAQATNDSLVIRVEGRAPVVLRAADLRSLPRDSVRSAMLHGEGVFRGPSLREVFNLAGIAVDSVHGPRLGQYALFEAKDRYRVVMGMTDLSEALTGRRMLLADEVDGKPLEAKAAPWQLVVPGDVRATRWVRQVVRISVVQAP